MAKRNPNRARRRNQQRAAAKGKTPAPKVASQPMRRLGLTWLHQKKRITLEQRLAGQTYGRDYRIDAISGMEPIKSNMDIAAGAGLGGSVSTGGIGPRAETDSAARSRLAEARAALAHQPDMVLACDLICGRELTPREINPDQRIADRMEQSLKIALDILARHYREAAALTKKLKEGQ